MDEAEEAGRDCSTVHAVLAAGTRPNHPWHRREMVDGWSVMLNEGDVGRCEPEEARLSIETATDKERHKQGYGWKPDDEKKAEVRPVAAHYR